MNDPDKNANPINESELLSKLPSPPGVALKLLNLYSSNDVSLDDLDATIRVDPALSAKLIKYSNSPSFARQLEAETLQQSIRMLGSNGVKMIALSFSLTEIGKDMDGGNFKIEEFWSSSLAVAISAKTAYRSANLNDEVGFLVGLLMNIGQMAMYCHDPESYNELLQDMEIGDGRLLELESEKYGYSRYSLSAKALRSWNFPESIIMAVESLTEESELEAHETRLLKLSAQMGYLFLAEKPELEVAEKTASGLADLTMLENEQIEELYNDALSEYAEVASILAYQAPSIRTLRELEQAAKQSLIELSLDMHMANAAAKAENNDLKNMAFVDALTGIGNRRQYETVAQAELDRSSRMGYGLCMIVIDIDKFKFYNDKFGHAAGDEVLSKVASEIKSTLRSYDHLFRFGGDEFVILAAESNIVSCKAMAERVREKVEACEFNFDGESLNVTISLGGALYQRGNSAVVSDLFERADAALYLSKEAGRNQCFFDEDRAAIGEAPTIPTSVVLKDISNSSSLSPTAS